MKEETTVTIVGPEGEAPTDAPPLLQRRRVRKERQQAPAASHARWLEPRIAFDDLLYFYDVNVWHRRCVLAKSLLVGGLGWRVERAGDVVLDTSAGIDLLPEHPLVRLLCRPSADGRDTFDEIVQRLLVDFYALGNGYLELARDGRGRIAELYHIPGRTVRMDASIDAYWQMGGTRQVQLNNFGSDLLPGRNEVLHLRWYDPSSDYYGSPDWLAALGTMSLDRTVLEFNTRIFANSLMAHMAVVVEGGKLSPMARDALRGFLVERASGVANAGRVLLLEDERTQTRIRFEKLNLETKDLLIVEAQKHLRDTVIAAHGVPPRVLGIVTTGQLGATGEVEGQLRTFRETVLRPGKRLLESALNRIALDLDPLCSIRFTEMTSEDPPPAA